MQHRGRWNRIFRSSMSNRFQVRKIIRHDRSGAVNAAGYRRDRRLLLGTPELRSGVLGNRYTLELAQKIDVPIVASQLTICNRMQSNRFLPRDERENGFILYTPEFLGSEISFFLSGARRRQCAGAQKTADVIRSKWGLHLRLLE